MPDPFADADPFPPPRDDGTNNPGGESAEPAIILDLESPGPGEPEEVEVPLERPRRRRAEQGQRPRRRLRPRRPESAAPQPALPVEPLLEKARAGFSCASCGAPLDLDDRYCTSCGTEQGSTARDANLPPTTGQLSCRNCGALITAELNQRSYVCPFCDSAYVVELPEAVSGRMAPEFVLPFAVTREDALKLFRRWMKQNNWLRPGDLAAAHVRDKLKGVYLPFWSFAMHSESQWQASIGEYWYETQTYTTRDSKGRTVTRTRRVRRTEWWPLRGRHHRYYSGYLISASRGLTQEEAAQIMPYALAALKRFAPQFLAGWMCEEYSLEEEEARRICETEFRARAERDIAAFLPGDTYSGLSARVRLSKLSEDLILLPVYLLTYKYQEEVYRFLVNGQTGKIYGTKPWSSSRIGILVGGILLVILLVLGLVYLWPALQSWFSGDTR